MATTHSQLAKEWSVRNTELSPDMVNKKSTENVWWHCGACGNEYRAVIKSRVNGLCCPVCAERAVLAGYNDLATTDPELVQEWDYEKNSGVQPLEVSRNAMRSVWWRGACGHKWKDSIYNRAIDKAGCIYCAKEYRQNLPRKLILKYAKQMGVEVLFDRADTTGIPVEVYIPALKLAFIFVKKGTGKERSMIAIQKYLCHARGIECKVFSDMKNTEMLEKKIKTIMRHTKEA